MTDRETYARRMLIACITAAAMALEQAEKIRDPGLKTLALERAMQSVHSLSEPH